MPKYLRQSFKKAVRRDDTEKWSENQKVEVVSDGNHI